MSNEVHRFDVDAALDCVDLRFTGYIPSNDSLEFFNLIRIFTGQDFEIDTPIWHYFLADLLLGNIKREQFPYSEEIRRSITVDPSAIAINLQEQLNQQIAQLVANQQTMLQLGGSIKEVQRIGINLNNLDTVDAELADNE